MQTESEAYAAVLDYLSERQGFLERCIERHEANGHTDLDDLYAEAIQLEDWLTTLPPAQDGSRLTLRQRRSGMAERLIPLIDNIMRDGKVRTNRQVLADIGWDAGDTRNSTMVSQHLLHDERYVCVTHDVTGKHYRMREVGSVRGVSS